MFKLYLGWVHRTLELNWYSKLIKQFNNIFLNIAMSLCAFEKEMKKNYHSLNKYNLPYHDFNLNFIGIVQRQMTVIRLRLVTIL